MSNSMIPGKKPSYDLIQAKIYLRYQSSERNVTEFQKYVTYIRIRVTNRYMIYQSNSSSNIFITSIIYIATNKIIYDLNVALSVNCLKVSHDIYAVVKCFLIEQKSLCSHDAISDAFVVTPQ